MQTGSSYLISALNLRANDRCCVCVINSSFLSVHPIRQNHCSCIKWHLTDTWRKRNANLLMSPFLFFCFFSDENPKKPKYLTRRTHESTKFAVMRKTFQMELNFRPYDESVSSIFNQVLVSTNSWDRSVSLAAGFATVFIHPLHKIKCWCGTFLQTTDMLKSFVAILICISGQCCN